MQGQPMRKKTHRRGAFLTFIRTPGVFSTLAVAITVGAAAGTGAFTFIYAKGDSYLTNDPAACANCHVMREQYDGWIKSSHHDVATCNDCHTPHNFVGKWATKAINGFNHSFAFTTGRFPEPIQITPRNRRIAEASCRHCHEDITQAIDHMPRPEGELDCLRCHAGVGHGAE